VNTSIPSSSHPAYDFLPFRRVPLSTAAWAVAVGMAFVLPAIYAIHYFLPLPGASVLQVTTKAKLLAATPMWLLAMKSLLIYPVVEECVYRGVILQLLRRYLPLWVALVPPTLLFGVTHLGSSATNAVFAAFVGLVFAWLAIRSRSLVPAILCHSAVNLFAVFLLPLLLHLFGVQAATTPAALTHPLPLVLLAVSTGVLVIGARKLSAAFRCSSTSSANVFVPTHAVAPAPPTLSR
jgi:membrane protease YdiL (CAAX protease family)